MVFKNVIINLNFKCYLVATLKERIYQQTETEDVHFSEPEWMKGVGFFSDSEEDWFKSGQKEPAFEAGGDFEEFPILLLPKLEEIAEEISRIRGEAIFLKHGLKEGEKETFREVIVEEIAERKLEVFDFSESNIFKIDPFGEAKRLYKAEKKLKVNEAENYEELKEATEGNEILEKKRGLFSKIQKYRKLLVLALGVLIGSAFLEESQEMESNTFFSSRENRTEPPEPKETPPEIIKKKKLSTKDLKEKNWQRIFSGEFSFEMFPKNYQKLINEKIERFTADCEVGERCIKDQIEQAYLRAKNYLPIIKKMLKDAGLPEIFAYLSFTESMWQPDVMSHAGAYGIVQFMPATAKWMGFNMLGEYSYFRKSPNRTLTENEKGEKTFVNNSHVQIYGSNENAPVYIYDERRDIVAAHEKKIEYLLKLKNGYEDESFILAAFRYNYGPGNISKILSSIEGDWDSLSKKEKTLKNKLKLFLEANSNSESYNYVANLMAFAKIVSGLESEKNPENKKLNLERVKIEFPRETIEVALEEGDTVVAVAQKYGINYQEILELNEIDISEAKTLPVGKTLKVPAPIKMFLTPEMIRKALKMGFEFYDLNLGIHDPRKKIAYADLKYDFKYKVQKKDNLAALQKKFAKRGVNKEKILKALNGKDLKAGMFLNLKGVLVIDNRDEKYEQEKNPENLEAMLPPIPNGFFINIPKKKVQLWKEFLKNI